MLSQSSITLPSFLHLEYSRGAGGQGWGAGGEVGDVIEESEAQ